MPVVSELSHVVYRHPDLSRAERFLTDFGLSVASRSPERICLRAVEGWPYVYVAEAGSPGGFAGFAFRLGSIEELRRAAAELGGAKPVPLEGGGFSVSLKDPDGRRVELVAGLPSVAPLRARPPLELNNGRRRSRVGTVQRLPKAPAQIQRLGHVALTASNLGRSLDWYTKTLGMLVTDYLYDGEPDRVVGAFLRCDRGAEWADHHTVALFASPKPPATHHVSFEVQDFDDVVVGREWLTSRGWEPVWGVGRHVLGSQIFDYWRDPSGNMVEHFTDGDLCRRDTPTGRIQAGPESLYQWGPEVPATFLG